VEPASIWFAIFEALTGSAEIIGNGGDRQLDHHASRRVARGSGPTVDVGAFARVMKVLSHR
jgi:hypothetical protein